MGFELYGMRIKFFILKGKSDYPSIHVRFWDSKRIDQKSNTGLKVYRSHWSPKKERVRSNTVDAKSKDFVNTELEALSRSIADNYIIESNSRQNIGTSWLRTQIEKHFGNIENPDNSHKSLYFMDWVQRYIDEAPEKLYRGKPISLKNYTTLPNNIQ